MEVSNPEAKKVRPCFKRLKKELEKIARKDFDKIGYWAEQTSEDEPLVWTAWVKGPSGSVYEGRVFWMYFLFTLDYPFKPPKVAWKSPIYHPNINPETESIALEEIEDAWSPALTVEKVLMGMQDLLCNPIDDPGWDLNVEAAKHFREDRSTFEFLATQSLPTSLSTHPLQEQERKKENPNDVRLKKELEQLAGVDFDDVGYWVKQRSEDELRVWTAKVKGPEGSVYESGVFWMLLTFPPTYPFKPPQVQWKSMIFHPNIDTETGYIAIDILKEGWSPQLSVAKILERIRKLLVDPILDWDLNFEAAKYFREDRSTFDYMAQQWTEKFGREIPDEMELWRL